MINKIHWLPHTSGVIRFGLILLIAFNCLIKQWNKLKKWTDTHTYITHIINDYGTAQHAVGARHSSSYNASNPVDWDL